MKSFWFVCELINVGPGNPDRLGLLGKQYAGNKEKAKDLAEKLSKCNPMKTYVWVKVCGEARPIAKPYEVVDYED